MTPEEMQSVLKFVEYSFWLLLTSAGLWLTFIGLLWVMQKSTFKKIDEHKKEFREDNDNTINEIKELRLDLKEQSKEYRDSVLRIETNQAKMMTEVSLMSKDLDEHKKANEEKHKHLQDQILQYLSSNKKRA